MPDFPATILAHAVSTPIPTGDTTPKPVTTTRRLDAFRDLDKATPRKVMRKDYFRLALT